VENQRETAVVGNAGRDEKDEVLHARTVSHRVTEHPGSRVPQTYSDAPQSPAILKRNEETTLEQVLKSNKDLFWY